MFVNSINYLFWLALNETSSAASNENQAGSRPFSLKLVVVVASLAFCGLADRMVNTEVAPESSLQVFLADH